MNSMEVPSARLEIGLNSTYFPVFMLVWVGGTAKIRFLRTRTTEGVRTPFTEYVVATTLSLFLFSFCNDFAFHTLTSVPSASRLITKIFIRFYTFRNMTSDRIAVCHVVGHLKSRLQRLLSKIRSISSVWRCGIVDSTCCRVRAPSVPTNLSRRVLCSHFDSCSSPRTSRDSIPNSRVSSFLGEKARFFGLPKV